MTIVQPASPYPDVPTGGSASNTIPFVATLQEEHPCGDDLELTLALTTLEGNFSVEVSYPMACDYVVETQTGQEIIPGETRLSNTCDDCTTEVSLPFPVQVYGVEHTTATASSNGNLQFGSDSIASYNTCLPTTAFAVAVAPYWDDLQTNGPGQGIYTALLGEAPNRQFVIEWRAGYYEHEGLANFEIVFERGVRRDLDDLRHDRQRWSLCDRRAPAGLRAADPVLV